MNGAAEDLRGTMTVFFDLDKTLLDVNSGQSGFATSLKPAGSRFGRLFRHWFGCSSITFWALT